MVHWYFDETVALDRMREIQRQADGACYAGRHQRRGFKGSWAIG